MQDAKTNAYRHIGVKLGQYLQTTDGAIPTTAALQALVADLIGDNDDLLVPMRDLVSRPSFQALIGNAGSGKGRIQRDCLIEEMRLIFSKQVISALEDLLDGFLDLPERQMSIPQAKDRLQLNSTDEAVSTEEIKRAAQRYDSLRNKARDLEKEIDLPLSPKKTNGINKYRLFIPFLVAVVAIIAGGTVLRRPPLCELLHLCSGERGSDNTRQILRDADSAKQAIRAATSLDDYRRALDQLNREIPKLSRSILTEDDKRTLQELIISARKAKALLVIEEKIQKRLEKARSILTVAQKVRGQEQFQQLSQIEDELAAIPLKSFASEEARELGQQLEQLREKNRRLQVEQPENPRPLEAYRPRATQRPQQRLINDTRSPATTRVNPTTSSQVDATTPYREEPLF